MSISTSTKSSTKSIIKSNDTNTFLDNINKSIDNNEVNSDEFIKIAKFLNNHPNIIENIIEQPNPLRCIAFCFNKQQCTKNKKPNSQFCGIHIKSTRYGIINQDFDNIINIDVFLTDIKGVLCYVDTYNNIYEAEDVIQKKTNPKIIGKLDGDNYISI
jgi:hypothetical protein